MLLLDSGRGAWRLWLKRELSPVIVHIGLIGENPLTKYLLRLPTGHSFQYRLRLRGLPGALLALKGVGLCLCIFRASVRDCRVCAVRQPA